MKRLRISPSFVISLAALFVALGGTAWAATGGNFILGKANTANAKDNADRNERWPGVGAFEHDDRNGSNGAQPERGIRTRTADDQLVYGRQEPERG